MHVLVTSHDIRIVDLTVLRAVYDDGLLVFTDGVGSASPVNYSTIWHSCTVILCLGCKVFKK